MSTINNQVGLGSFNKFILAQIFQHLDLADLGNSQCVSKFFKEAVLIPFPSSYAALANRLKIPLTHFDGETPAAFSNRALTLVKQRVLAQKTFKEAIKNNLANIVTYNSFIDAASKNGNFSAAQKAFERS